MRALVRLVIFRLRVLRCIAFAALVTGAVIASSRACAGAAWAGDPPELRMTGSWITAGTRP
jgi:hypothetical protein